MTDFNNTGASTTPDFDAMSPAELDSYIESGGQSLPEPPAEPVAPVADPVADPVAEEPLVPTADEPVVEEPAADEEPVAEEMDEATILEQIAAFKFTENATPEVRAQEEAAYAALVEIPEPIQAMIDYREARIAELETAAQSASNDPVQIAHSEALDSLVGFVPDGEGGYVPNTAPLRKLYMEHYPTEYAQLKQDILLEPSAKYAGYTVYQEGLRDLADLTDSQMQTIGKFIENGGKFDFPAFVPEGIPAEVGQAYWLNPDRKEIDAKLEQIQFVLRDERATAEEKAEAEAEAQKLNRHLAIVQKGLDADAREEQLERQGKVSNSQQIVEAGTAAYIGTTLGIVEQFADDLAKSLTMFDPVTAKALADAFSIQVTSALGDVDEYAKAAQKQLAAAGVKMDWSKASDALNRLYDCEKQIEGLKLIKANQRAVEIEQRKKTNILLELKGIQKNVIGHLASAITTGHGKALNSKLASAPKNTGRPSAVRPRIPGSSPGAIGDKKLEDMSLEELNSHIGRLRAANGGG